MNSSLKKIILFSMALFFIHVQASAMDYAEAREATKELKDRINILILNKLCMQIIGSLNKAIKDTTDSCRYYELERNMRGLKDEDNQVVEFAEKIVSGCRLPSNLKAHLIPLLIAASQVILTTSKVKNNDEKLVQAVYIYCTNYIIKNYHPVKII